MSGGWLVGARKGAAGVELAAVDLGGAPAGLPEGAAAAQMARWLGENQGFDIAWYFRAEPDLGDLAVRMGDGQGISGHPDVVWVFDLRAIKCGGGAL